MKREPRSLFSKTYCLEIIFGGRMSMLHIRPPFYNLVKRSGMQQARIRGLHEAPIRGCLILLIQLHGSGLLFTYSFILPYLFFHSHFSFLLFL